MRLEPIPYPEIGPRIAKIRTALEKSQSQLAREIGCSQSGVSQIEDGKRHPTYKMLVRIADAFNMRLGKLVDP